MTNKNIIEQYDSEVDSTATTEDELKSIQTKSYVATPQQVETVKKEAFVQRGEFVQKDVTKEEVGVIEFAEKAVVEAPKTSAELSTDYQYIRTNLYTITERSIEALNNLVQIADQSQHPRAYEVVALMVNSIASAQKDLMNIHQQKAKIESISSKNSPEIVNNNLFVGNTAELDEIIKRMTKQSSDSTDE